MRILMLACAALALTACNSGVKTSEDGKSTTFTADGKSVSMTQNDTANASLPDNLPRYPEATTDEAVSLNDANMGMTNVTLLTKDEPKKVRDFYIAALDKDGRKYMERTSGSKIFIHGKDDVFTSMITISPDDQGRGTSVSFVKTDMKDPALK